MLASRTTQRTALSSLTLIATALPQVSLAHPSPENGKHG